MSRQAGRPPVQRSFSRANCPNFYPGVDAIRRGLTFLPGQILPALLRQHIVEKGVGRVADVIIVMTNQGERIAMTGGDRS